MMNKIINSYKHLLKVFMICMIMCAGLCLSACNNQNTPTNNSGKDDSKADLSGKITDNIEIVIDKTIYYIGDEFEISVLKYPENSTASIEYDIDNNDIISFENGKFVCNNIGIAKITIIASNIDNSIICDSIDIEVKQKVQYVKGLEFDKSNIRYNLNIDQPIFNIIKVSQPFNVDIEISYTNDNFVYDYNTGKITINKDSKTLFNDCTVSAKYLVSPNTYNTTSFIISVDSYIENIEINKQYTGFVNELLTIDYKITPANYNNDFIVATTYDNLIIDKTTESIKISSTTTQNVNIKLNYINQNLQSITKIITINFVNKIGQIDYQILNEDNEIQTNLFEDKTYTLKVWADINSNQKCFSINGVDSVKYIKSQNDVHIYEIKFTSGSKNFSVDYMNVINDISDNYSTQIEELNIYQVVTDIDVLIDNESVNTINLSLVNDTDTSKQIEIITHKTNLHDLGYTITNQPVNYKIQDNKIVPLIKGSDVLVIKTICNHLEFTFDVVVDCIDVQNVELNLQNDLYYAYDKDLEHSYTTTSKLYLNITPSNSYISSVEVDSLNNFVVQKSDDYYLITPKTNGNLILNVLVNNQSYQKEINVLQYPNITNVIFNGQIINDNQTIEADVVNNNVLSIQSISSNIQNDSEIECDYDVIINDVTYNLSIDSTDNLFNLVEFVDGVNNVTIKNTISNYEITFVLNYSSVIAIDNFELSDGYYSINSYDQQSIIIDYLTSPNNATENLTFSCDSNLISINDNVITLTQLGSQVTDSTKLTIDIDCANIDSENIIQKQIILDIFYLDYSSYQPITNGSQLSNIGGINNYYLANDVQISNASAIESFGGNLYGNNHTIKLIDSMLMTNLLDGGVLQNIHFEIEVNSTMSNALMYSCLGKIKNISISMNINVNQDDITIINTIQQSNQDNAVNVIDNVFVNIDFGGFTYASIQLCAQYSANMCDIMSNICADNHTDNADQDYFGRRVRYGVITNGITKLI